MEYLTTNYKSFRVDDDGSSELMANFTAEIVRETRIVDGITSRSVLTIAGQMPPTEDGGEPVQLPEVEIPSDEFEGMKWVTAAWGVRCVVRPGSGIRDDLRTMIQVGSDPEVTTIYRQTGWETIEGRRTYLHAGGGITARGNDPSVQVRMPHELRHYDLSADVSPQDGLAATLGLLEVFRPDLAWPLIAGTLAPLYGPCDFAVHLTGRTGSYKSEITSLMQSHYGPKMDARSLPGSWSSTPNALEALAYFARNAVFTIDDFVPTGTTWQQRAYQTNADKIIRAQGNQAGRARLTDVSSLQQTMYPRGLILSTGEDTPEGHSVRARMLILEVVAGEVEPPALTAAQAERPNYVGTTRWLCQSLARRPAELTPRVQQLRTEYRDVGHSRTPSMLARLVAVCEDVCQRAMEDGLLTQQDARHYAAAAKAGIEAAGDRQMSYLEDADPVDLFNGAIRQIVASGLGHFRTLNGGVPSLASALGFTSERSLGELDTFRARGPCIGWVLVPKDELYLDVAAGFAVVKKVAGPDLALSKQTLFKRLKDAGAVVRVDDGRQRNTIRVTAEGHPRQVLCLSLSTVLDREDMTDGDSDGAGDGVEE